MSDNNLNQGDADRARVINLLIELAFDGSAEITDQLLDRHGIIDQNLRLALIEKKTEKIKRLLEEDTTNFSAIYSIRGEMNITADPSTIGTTLTLKASTEECIAITDTHTGITYEANVISGTLSTDGSIVSGKYPVTAGNAPGSFNNNTITVAENGSYDFTLGEPGSEVKAYVEEKCIFSVVKTC